MAEIVPLNPAAPQPSAVEQATAAARANIEQHGTAAPAPAAQPRVPAGDPDGKGGRFNSDVVKDLGGAPADPAPDAGQTPPTPPVPPAGEQPPAPTPKPGEGQPAPKPGEQAPPEGEVEGEVDEERVVRLKNAEGEDIELELDDPVLAAAVREAAEVAQRIDTIVEQVDTERDEISAERAMIQHNPVGYMLDVLGDDPEQLDEIVLFLASDPAVQKRIAPMLAKVLTDKNVAADTHASHKRRIDDAAATVSRAVEQNRVVAANVREITSALNALVPETLEAGAREVALGDLRREVAEYATRNNLVTLPVHQLPTLLANRLRLLGVDPATAAKRIQSASPVRHKAARYRGSAAPAGAPPAGSPPAAPKAKPNGQQFVKGQERRAAAGSIPGAGAGAPGTPGALEAFKNPDGSAMSIEQTIAEHRRRVNSGVRVLGT